MEKVYIGNHSYDIKEIDQVSRSLIKIVFTDEIPKSFGEIEVRTHDNKVLVNIQGYTTVFKREEKTIYLSNDTAKLEGFEDGERVVYDGESLFQELLSKINSLESELAETKEGLLNTQLGLTETVELISPMLQGD